MFNLDLELNDQVMLIYELIKFNTNYRAYQMFKYPLMDLVLVNIVTF